MNTYQKHMAIPLTDDEQCSIIGTLARAVAKMLGAPITAPAYIPLVITNTKGFKVVIREMINDRKSRNVTIVIRASDVTDPIKRKALRMAYAAAEMWDSVTRVPQCED